MKLALVISSLENGTPSVSSSMLANYRAAGGECVTLIALSGSDTDFDPLDSRVKRYSLNLVDRKGVLHFASGLEGERQ